jgi:hypothetical protein
MTAIQRNFPVIVIVLLLLLLALGIFGFVETQQSVPPRDFIILADE